MHFFNFQTFWKEEGKGYWLNPNIRDVLGRLRSVWSLLDAVSETRSINTDTGFILFVQLQTLLPILLICLPVNYVRIFSSQSTQEEKQRQNSGDWLPLGQSPDPRSHGDKMGQDTWLGSWNLGHLDISFFSQAGQLYVLSFHWRKLTSLLGPL